MSEHATRPVRRVLLALLAPALVVTAMGCGGNGPDQPVVGEVTTIGAAEFTNYNISVAAGGDTVAVVWNDYDDVEAVERPFIATSTDSGTRFGEPVLLDDADPFLAYPELAADEAGTIFVSVTRYLEGEADGWPALYVSTDAGVTFAKRADLVDAPSVVFGYGGSTVAVSPDGERVVLAWAHATTGPNDPSAMWAATSSDGGATFGEPQLIGVVIDPVATRPRAFFADDRAVVAFGAATPIPDAPAPTPANPNPEVAVPGVGVVIADESGVFAPAVRVADPGALPRVVAPGGASGDDGAVSLAWWRLEESGGGTALVADGGPDGFGDATPIFTTETLNDPSTASATALELDRDGDGVLWALLSVDGEQSPETRLLRIVGGEDPELLDEVSSPRLASGVEYDLAALPGGGAVVAWFEAMDVKVRLVRA